MDNSFHWPSAYQFKDVRRVLSRIGRRVTVAHLNFDLRRGFNLATGVTCFWGGGVVDPEDS